MPEGHTLHRLAAEYLRVFGGEPVHVTSPQGPFAPSAARLDGRPLTATDAHGKHLFLGFAGDDWIHIHLGLYGKVRFGEFAPGPGPAPAPGPAPDPDPDSDPDSRESEPPLPVGQIRLRLVGPRGYADLRGPTTCALVSGFEKKEIQHRLGPDPLRVGNPPGSGPADPTGEAAWARVSRSSTTIAALLMDQKVLSGVGNIYRAEVLFRQGIDPRLPGRALTRPQWDAIWADLVRLMRDGVRDGWIDTVRPEHTPRAMGRAAREDAHGGEVYVYRRAQQPCLVCGTPVRIETHVGRNLFWCPNCQPPHRG